MAQGGLATGCGIFPWSRRRMLRKLRCKRGQAWKMTDFWKVVWQVKAKFVYYANFGWKFKSSIRSDEVRSIHYLWTYWILMVYVLPSINFCTLNWVFHGTIDDQMYLKKLFETEIGSTIEKSSTISLVFARICLRKICHFSLVQPSNKKIQIVSEDLRKDHLIRTFFDP